MTAIPRLSIGLPVYNGEAYLAQSIEALLGQSYPDFELIISDNASTDSTGSICQSYARQDSRVRYIRQRANIGLSPNHNFVLEQARGEFFKWAASDDLYGRDLMKRCVAALDERPDVILAHAYEAAIDEAGTVTQAMDYPLATDSPRPPERFRAILLGSSGLFDSTDPAAPGLVRMDNNGMLRACDEYGVIRTAVMRKIAPLGSYHHSDRIVVCELALHGPFYIVPEWLYFRRDTADRTYNQSPKLRHRCEVMDPARRNRLRHPTARLVAEYFLGYAGAIQRAPIPAADRRACYRHLAWWIQDRAVGKVVTRQLVPAAEQLAAGDHSASVSVEAVVAGQENRRRPRLATS